MRLKKRRWTKLQSFMLLNAEAVIAVCSVPPEWDEDPNSFVPTHETIDHFYNTGRNYHAPRH